MACFFLASQLTTVSFDVCIRMCSYILAIYNCRRPSGTDKEFFIQLFAEADKNLTMPTTELLLLRMFKSQKITFEKVHGIAICYLMHLCITQW